MPVHPFLLEQVLRLPKDKDVSDSPIVTSIILSDPANVADLVPYLEQTDSVMSANARRVMCLFEASAAPHLLSALSNRSVVARRDGVDVLWALMAGEPRYVVRDTLEKIASAVEFLLDDKRPLPDRMPPYIERDFRGRICDLTFIVLSHLMDPEFNQSLFRSLDDDGRDEAIARLRRRGLRPGLV
jgi:hypothetical protein